MLTLRPLSEDHGRSSVLLSRQSLSLRIQVWNSHTRTCVWTPWSVFQDGSYEPLQANTVERADKAPHLGGESRACTNPNLFQNDNPEKALAHTSQSTPSHQRQLDPGGSKTPRFWQGANPCWQTPKDEGPTMIKSQLIDPTRTRSAPRSANQSRTIPSARRRFHTLASQRFQARLTLFPKYFAPFPHGTCSLSDSS